MPKELEIEFKNLLTKDEFTLLLRTFHIKDDNFFTQKNHYFDTSNFLLKEKAAALRIRELLNRYELTLKRKAQTGVLETNQCITQKEADLFFNENLLPSGEVEEALMQLDIPIPELTYFGSLTTHRAEMDYKNGLLVFDHSCYLDQEDFELEYEVIDQKKGNTIFTDLLNQLNIHQKTADTKIGRLYKEKRKIMKQANEE